MIKKAYSLTLAAFALASSLLLVACGGGEDSASAPPTVAITSALDANGTDVVFTFTFSQNVGSTFTAEDVTVSGGVAGTFAAVGDGTHFTLAVTPNSPVVSVTVPPGKYSAVARNSNVAKASQSFTLSPTITFSENGLVAYAYEGLTSAEVVNDPAGGANKVLKLVKGPASQPWGLSNLQVFGTEYAPTVPVINFTNNKTITIKSYSDADIGTKITLKVESTLGGAMAAQASTTKKNEWETLSFDFSTPVSGAFSSTAEFNRITIIPSWTEIGGQASPALTANKIFYFDDITYTPLQEPIKTAATPSVSAANVKSLMSSNTNYAVTGATFSNPWAGTPATSVTIGSRSIKMYGGLTFALIDLSSVQDLTDYSYISVDVWSSKATTFKVKIVDYGADGVNKYSGENLPQDDSESEIAAPFIVGGGWQTIKINLSALTGLNSRTKVGQIVLSATDAPNVYIDNVFFAKVLVPTAAAATPTVSQTKALAIITSNSNYTVKGATFSLSQYNVGTPVEDFTLSGRSIKKYPALTFSIIETSGTMNLSAYDYVSIDVWTGNSSSLSMVLVDYGADGLNKYSAGGLPADDTESEQALTPALQGAWKTYKINLSDFTGLSKRDAVGQILLKSDNGATIFIDNLFFGKN